MNNTLVISLFLILGIGVISVIVFLILDEGGNKEICKDYGINDDCNKLSIECYEDCISLGKIYFKFDLGTWGSSAECWCKKQNEVQQIW